MRLSHEVLSAKICAVAIKLVGVCTLITRTFNIMDHGLDASPVFWTSISNWNAYPASFPYNLYNIEYNV